MSGIISGFRKKDADIEKGAKRDEYLDMKMRMHLASARIKPHYLGNVLTGIYYLCDTDTEKAKDTVLAFSEYLRQSVDAMERKDLLPFSWELGHIQNYLFLENLRLKDKLEIFYEIDIDDFELPSLSVQPIVENAVKHGIAPLERKGTLKILTRRCADGGVKIIVSDDGVGFDTKILDGKSDEPCSLECIKKRLQDEVGGQISIESMPGQGTNVTITFVPKKNE